MVAMIIASIVSLVLSGGFYYLLMPSWSLACGEIWWFFFGVSLICLFSYGVVTYIMDEYYIPTFISAGALGVVLVLAIVLNVISMPVFHASDFRNAHKIQVSADETTLEALPVVENKDDIPIIDVYTARKLGDRAMGVMEKYLSQYEVSNEYSLIQYKGEFFRISPLEYGGFWKYNNSKATGIPGYVMVNIYTGEAKLVELPPEQAIRYAPSAFWGKDMFRHLRTKYPTAIFGDYHFEIDENGTPYYIVATMRSTAGVFGAKVVDGFVVMNAATGESNYYEFIAMPDWIDNVYSVDQLMKQVNWHFEYIHGAWNFSAKDVRKTSYSFDKSQYYLYPDGEDIILYTGVTSAGNDESNIGFILANMRTGETTYFASPGAEESSAQESAKGLVQQYGYSSGPVMLVSIDGIETYFLTLKDHQGLVKQYALVNKEDYNVVSVAETVEQVVYSYRRKVSGFEAEGDAGTVNTVYTAVIDGNTTYVFTLNGIDATYLSDISVNYEQHYKLTPGQKVQLAYIEQGTTRIVTSLGFLVDIREQTE